VHNISTAQMHFSKSILAFKTLIVSAIVSFVASKSNNAKTCLQAIEAVFENNSPGKNEDFKTFYFVIISKPAGYILTVTLL